MAYELQAEERTIFGKKVKKLRQAGQTPAEIYGRGSDNQSVQINAKELRNTLREAGLTNLISIKVGDKAPVQALARNLQFSPIKRTLLHVDFYTVKMDEKVTVTVPVQLTGESDLVKDLGGTLMSGLTTLDIEALPADLPESIDVDISILESFSDSISVADLSLADGITVLSNAESLIATVQPPRTEEEEAALDGEVDALEVEGEEEEEESEE
ncbi:MAG: 50S ribosomal protein L25/general stress protein Ctc [Chloroflexota bacterium]